MNFFERMKLAYRFLLLGIHLLAGIVMAIFTGAAFVQYRRFQQPFVRWWHRRFCKILGLDIRIQGQPLDDNALWVSNHVSWLDIPGLGAHFPVYFLSKAEIEKWPIVGFLARISGTLFIKRGAGDAGKITDQLVSHLDSGRNILFFPEGTTTDGQQLKRFFHHLFASAVETDTPVQPVVIAYLDEQGKPHADAPFVGDANFFPHAIGIFKAPKIVVNILVLPPEPVNGRNTRALSKAVEVRMAQGLRQLLGE